MKNEAALTQEINKEEIKSIQDRVDTNSVLINELTNKLVSEYCNSLDKYITFIQSILQDDKKPPTAQELDDFVMNLPVLLYFCGEAQENLGIKTDVSKAIKQEKYNEIFKQVQGTIADKTSKSELATRSEIITNIIYDRAYKIVKEKIAAAYELLSSIKKVISRRISEYDLSKMSNPARKNSEDSVF